MESSGRPGRIILIGPSGSGKSSLATALAAALGYEALDTDAAIVARAGMPIAEFFARFGEPAFRALESETLADACRRERVVIATGGGAVLAEENWRVMRPGSVILALRAAPETLAARVREQTLRDGAAERPLLAGDAVSRMRAMLAVRQALYDRADATLDTEALTLERARDAALAAVRRAVAEGRVPLLSIGTPNGRSDIHVGRGLAERLPALLGARWPRTRRCWIVSDEHVAAHWLDRTRASFVAAGFETRDVVVPAGEGSKSLAQVARLCDELTTGGVTRRDAVVALGGGVVGDLAGFVAAIALRGLPLAQLPTSLLAMVDSSVGGKTGVNTPAGKNLVGAFYQPGLVVVDPTFLSTLPRAEYHSGMAEVIKHALIQPATPLGGEALLAELESAPSLDPLPEERVERVLALNVAIKASVVQADEREAGLRMILNFGHTAGHAIEADGYRYRHGEAVALGMQIALRIAHRMRMRMGVAQACPDERLNVLLARAGLPTRLVGRADSVLERLDRDKKNVDGALHWILPDERGIVGPLTGVPLDVAREALLDLGAT